MRFSLRSRFRGAFLGAALGQGFATVASQFSKGGIAPANTHPADRASHQEQTARNFLSFAQFCTPPGEIDSVAGNWGRQAVQQTRDIINPQPVSQPTDDLFDDPSQPASAIEFLPLILLCHESQEQLQHALMPRIANWSPAQQTEVWVIAAIMMLMLKEEFVPDQIIPLLLEGRQFPSIEQSHELVDQLQQIQSWLLDQTPIAMLPAVSLSPGAAALYSVLKTPASFPLALLHTLRLQPDPETAALVGLLAGTHLSEAGLPIGWRNAFDRYQSTMLQASWDVSSIAELLELADRLWAVWSGAFQPQHWQSLPTTITAVPRLVRPR